MRLRRLGRLTALTGTVLIVAGVVAVVLLVADADSTLHLYTDRLVVAIVGFVVLVPAIALTAIGFVMTIASESVGAPAERPAIDSPRSVGDRGETDAG